MNEYNIKVDFTKGKIFTNLKELVQNDYNTTKLNFTFDKEGRVLFKLLYPDGTQYVDEIQNNELIFGKGVLNQEGTYEYEIALYTADGRLTDHATKSFEVRSELVDTDELVGPDDRVPVLDTLINEVNTIKQDVEDGKYNGKDGSDGQNGITPAIGENGNWYIGDIDTGKPSQGPKGDKGETGKQGIQGLQGTQGEKGDKGDVGPQGPAGESVIELTENPVILSELETGIYKLNAGVSIQLSNGSYNPGLTTGAYLLNVFQYYTGKYAYYIDQNSKVTVLNATGGKVKEYNLSNFATNDNIDNLNVLIGDLTTLATTEQSSLVGAINEIANNSGNREDNPIIEAKLQSLTISNTSNSYALGTADKEIISEVITKAYANNDGYPVILLKTASITNFKLTSVTSILTKPTSWYMEGFTETLVSSGHASFGIIFINASISIMGEWNDDIFTCTYFSMNLDRPQYLSKTNTREYTPTSDYNPATKKYVDDAISALKAELEG